MKKRLALLCAAVVMVCAILIPPVRAVAESALSVFRVADAKTITISVSDLQALVTFIKDKDAALKPADEARMKNEKQFSVESEKSGFRTLNSIREFKAFPFNLPTALKNETPKLTAADSKTHQVTLDTEKVNAALTKLGAATLVDSSYNGTAVTISTPPFIVAEYSGVMLAATQSVHIDAPDAALKNLWSSVLSIKSIPDDLRTQLKPIDPKTRDIYLPVIEGLGRETSLGTATGYIYSSGDLAQVLSALPGFTDDTHLAALRDKNASALIWTKNGVLYCLAGEKSDSELTQIARSIR